MSERLAAGAHTTGDASARTSLSSRVPLAELLVRFEEPIPPRFYRQIAKLRVAMVSLLTAANIAGSLAIFVQAPIWDLGSYFAHQGAILILGAIELGVATTAWRARLSEAWNRRLALAATVIEVAILVIGMHGMGSVNSHMVSLAVLAVVLYRLLFDLQLAGAMLVLLVGSHWALVVLEALGWLRPQLGMPELDTVYRVPAWQVGSMTVITSIYLVGFVMAHWAVLRLRRREAALRVLREAFAAVDPERVGELTGAVLGGRYEVRELLGRGGSSEVYAGAHVGTRRPVAIKVLAARLAGRAEALARFRREAAITGQLDSPEIVRILDVDEDGGYPFLVLELLRGEDLRARVKREGPLSVEQTLCVASSIAAGLDVAHAAGVVHRDLKPANVFLCEGDASAKILDFGIARPEAPEGETITRDARVLGTPAFMAPEQLWPSLAPISAATDVFALGATLYYALTGRAPYPSELSPALHARGMIARPEPVSALRPELPEALDDVLLVAMAARPEDRFASARDLLDAMRAALEGRLPAGVARMAAAERRTRAPRAEGPSAPDVSGVATVTETASSPAARAQRS